MRPFAGGFVVVARHGEPGDLVVVPDPRGRRTVCLVRPTSRAVVLGSTQPADTIDATAAHAAGYGIVRRRSGGGAVPVAPGAQAWVDLYVPRGDPLFVEDVGQSARWVGQAWASAIGALVGAAGLVVADGPLRPTRWSRRWCFSGRGPGEVDRCARKVLGISQRRDRAGAWFFTMVRTAADPSTEAGFLALSDAERAEFAAELTSAVGSVAVAPERLEEAFLDALEALDASSGS